MDPNQSANWNLDNLFDLFEKGAETVNQTSSSESFHETLTKPGSAEGHNGAVFMVLDQLDEALNKDAPERATHETLEVMNGLHKFMHETLDPSQGATIERTPEVAAREHQEVLTDAVETLEDDKEVFLYLQYRLQKAFKAFYDAVSRESTLDHTSWALLDRVEDTTVRLVVKNLPAAGAAFEKTSLREYQAAFHALRKALSSEPPLSTASRELFGRVQAVNSAIIRHRDTIWAPALRRQFRNAMYTWYATISDELPLGDPSAKETLDRIRERVDALAAEEAARYRSREVIEALDERTARQPALGQCARENAPVELPASPVELPAVADFDREEEPVKTADGMQMDLGDTEEVCLDERFEIL